MSLTVELPKLRAMIRKTGLIANGSTRDTRTAIGRLSATLSATSLRLVQGCFLNSRSPSGGRWRKLKLRKGGLPLMHTLQMFRAIAVRQVLGGFAVVSPAKQSAVQNYGATIVPRASKVLVFPGPNGLIFAKKVTIPRRQFIPERLPGAWKKILEGDVHAAMREWVKTA